MTILPRPSVSPLYSFCSVRPDVVPRYVSFAETFSAVWGWLRGREPDWRERAREQRVIEMLAEELEVELTPTGGHKAETRSPETSSPESPETRSGVSSHRRDESHVRPG
jgi:hypothetical protein